MRRLSLLACCGLFLGAPPAFGQQPNWYHEGYRHAYGDDNADAVVRGWYQRYLRRTATNGEELGWAQALHDGQPSQQVLAGILGSDEYYTNAGGTPEQFVFNLFYDLNARKPTDREMDTWVRRMHIISPTDLAYEMQTRFPQAGPVVVPYFPDDHRYDVRRPVLRPWQKH